jgi:hypothetical protein
MTFEKAEEVIKAHQAPPPLSDAEFNKTFLQLKQKLEAAEEEDLSKIIDEPIHHVSGLSDLDTAVLKVLEKKFDEFDQQDPSSRNILHPEKNPQYDAGLAQDFEHYCLQLEDQPSDRPKDIAPEEDHVAEKIFDELRAFPFGKLTEPESISKYLNDEFDKVDPNDPKRRREYEEAKKDEKKKEKYHEGFEYLKDVHDDRFWFNFANGSLVVIVIFLLTMSFHEEAADRKETASMRIRVKDYPWGENNLILSPHAREGHGDHH